MMAAQRDEVERMLDAGLPEQKGGKSPAERISQLKETIRPLSGDVGDDDGAAVKLLEYLLVNAVVFVGLLSVDDHQLEAVFVLHHGLYHDVEEILHRRVFGIGRIEQPH